jgi:O-antigen ligase
MPTMSKLPIWTPLASILLALAWLLPNASPPWPAFHKDAWSAFVFCLVAAVVVFRRQAGGFRGFYLDPMVAVLLLLAVLPVEQWGLGIVHFSGHAAVGFGYFSAAALACLIGRTWEQSDPGKPGDFLFLALLLAALGTSWLMLAQWLRLDVNDVWVNPLPSWGRPYGNLVQPNNAATLLILGMVSLFWFAVQGRIGKVVWGVGSAYLLFLVVLTGSRSGYLSLLVVTLLGLFMGWRRAEFRPWRGAFGLLLGLFPLFVFLVTRDWGGETAFAQQPFERNLTSARLLVYRAYLEAAWASPWLGYGFEQGAVTQLASAALGHQLPGLFTWAHNAFLDLATWFGIPVALLAMAAVAVSLVAVLRGPFDMKRAVYFAGTCVVFLHGMVELPLAYAYFLLPASLMAGAMLAGLKVFALPLPRAGVATVLVGLIAMLGVITHDYLQIESAFYTWRFKQANVGRNHPMDVPDTLLLNQAEALLVGLRGTPESMTGDSLREFEQAVFLEPSAAALQHLAELQLGRGDIAAAQRTADMGRLLTQGKERKALAARWRYLGTQDPAFLAVVWRE